MIEDKNKVCLFLSLSFPFSFCYNKSINCSRHANVKFYRKDIRESVYLTKNMLFYINIILVWFFQERILRGPCSNYSLDVSRQNPPLFRLAIDLISATLHNDRPAALCHFIPATYNPSHVVGPIKEINKAR